jgi:LTXXQ motif family protein
MKTLLLFALALAASLSTAGFLTSASAQMPRPQAQQQQADDEQDASAADRAAFFNARLAALHAVLALNAEQEKLWPPVEAAIRAASKEATETAQKLHAQPEPTNAVELLGVIADVEIARAMALKKLVTAFQPLLAALTPEQKRRIPAFLGIEDSDTGPSSGELWIFQEESH